MYGKTVNLKDINALKSDTVCAVLGAHMQQRDEIFLKYSLHVALRNTTEIMLVNVPVPIGNKKSDALNNALKSAPFPIVGVAFDNLEIRKYNINGREFYSGTATDFTIINEPNNIRLLKYGGNKNEKNIK